MHEKTTDIIIIGAGPAGLFAAFYAGMRNLSVKLIDSLPQVGGQPQALYPEKNIYDIAGFPKITGHELTEQLTRQISRFESTTSIHLSEEVLKFERENNHFIVHTDKATHQAKAIIIAAGNGSFHPRKIEMENLADYEGHGVTYNISNLDQYSGATLAICGGGDSALDMALALKDYAKKIYIIHRRDRFRAHEHSVDVAQAAENIEFITPFVPIAVAGDGSRLTKICLQEPRAADVMTLAVDGVIMAYGFVSSIGPLKNWQLKSANNMIAVNQHFETSEPGIYAIGDIATYPGKVKLIASGFGEAPSAINEIVHYLYPERGNKPLHSSNMFAE